MFARKSAIQSRELLEYLAKAQFDQSKRLREQLAEADEKNAALDSAKRHLESLLQDALALDSFIDLDSLKEMPRIPAFTEEQPQRKDYLPQPPSSLGFLLPWKRRNYDKQYVSAEAKYREARQAYIQALQAHHTQTAREQAQMEEHNQEIEQFKRDFATGESQAIEKYFKLVLEQSEYPAAFPKRLEVAYSADAEKLSLDVALPAADVIPAAKGYEYDRSRDEILPIALPEKRRRRLYSQVLAQISLRSVYEIFKADRTQAVDSIVLNGYVDGINPSTGRPGRFCLVAFEITRRQFDGLDLRRVEPLACLKSLNAQLSSKPDQLLAVPAMPVNDRQAATVSNAAELPYPTQRISELESANQTQSEEITALEGMLEAQRDRIAELVPELRDEQKRAAELQVEIQRQKDYIAELESRLETRNDDIAAHESESTEAPDDTQSAAGITDFTSGSEISEAEIFAPITSETPDDGYGGAAIPPRAPEAGTTSPMSPHPELLAIMSIVLQANGRWVSCSQAGLKEYQVARLVAGGMLMRHDLGFDRVRSTPAGAAWHHKHRQRQEPPKQNNQEDFRQNTNEEEKTISLGELLRDPAGSPTAADIKQDATAQRDNTAAKLLQRPAASSDDTLTVLNELVTIAADFDGDEAKLLALMMTNNWECSEARIQSAFPGQFISSIILDINENVYEVIEDTLIEEEDGRLVVDEEYRDTLEQALQQTDNPYIADEWGRQ